MARLLLNDIHVWYTDLMDKRSGEYMLNVKLHRFRFVKNLGTNLSSFCEIFLKQTKSKNNVVVKAAD